RFGPPPFSKAAARLNKFQKFQLPKGEKRAGPDFAEQRRRPPRARGSNPCHFPIGADQALFCKQFVPAMFCIDDNRPLRNWAYRLVGQEARLAKLVIFKKGGGGKVAINPEQVTHVRSAAGAFTDVFMAGQQVAVE